MAEECEHDWSYAPGILTSCPPQQNRICRKCGKKERITLGTYEVNDYYQIVEKFKNKEV